MSNFAVGSVHVECLGGRLDNSVRNDKSVHVNREKWASGGFALHVIPTVSASFPPICPELCPRWEAGHGKRTH
jgi:hypothetical protein